MKKILSLILVLACLASLIVVPASAAGLDKATIQKAVIETAYAYYRKGMKIDYDSSGITYQNRTAGGVSRLSTGDSPEEAADDSLFYTVCSDWCYDVYFNAFGYEVYNGRKCYTEVLTGFPMSNPTVLYKFHTTDKDAHTADRQDFIAKVKQIWEPGDIIVGYGSSGGHAMLYIGDTNGDGKTEIMHSSGNKMSLETGIDNRDNPRKDTVMGIDVGSVRIDDTEEHLFTPGSSSSHNLTKDKYSEMILLRPSLDPAFPTQLTPSAQSRLKFPGLDIDRSSSLHKYNSAQTGDEITVTVTLKNFSDKALTGIPVTEKLPEGATIVEGSANNGGTISASGIAWKVDVAPKAEVKLSYKVKVTAARSAFVKLPGGMVDQIPTRDLSYVVMGKPLAAPALEQMASGKLALPAINVSDLEFANEFYRTVLDMELGLPSKMQDVMDALLTEKTGLEKVSGTPDNKMLQLKPADQLNETGKYIASMIIPEHASGRALWKPTQENTQKPLDRTREYLIGAYQPGDIFVGTQGDSILEVKNPADVVVYVYVGNGRVATFNGKTAKLVSFSDSISTMMRMKISFALRPSLAFDDVNTKVVPFKFTDVKSNAWYYSFVKSLVIKKVINGMNETTFAPNGKLTNGQALKLITLAVGEKEQAAANGHWAGGYLTFAKSKGWLAKDVNLDANITRLDFCRIAAKAAGVSGKPEVNPFVDTSDASVLALYNAGIINGMTAATFQPEGLLTRAQISKIICLLQAQ